MPVLNPVIRMAWIRKHWSDYYVKKATEIVKSLVSLNLKSDFVIDYVLPVDGRVLCSCPF
jgi:hypothetical protein